MDYESFSTMREDGAHIAWEMRLRTLYMKIRSEAGLEDDLDIPSFIFSQEKWGSWCPELYAIKLCDRLMTHFSFDAVEHVLRHEMAHQLVDAWSYKSSHGEAWKRACKILGAIPERLTTDNFLSHCRGSYDEDPIVDRVRKLLIKGHDHAVTEEESEIFLKKAQSMMARHQISMFEICGNDRLMLPRPVGPMYKRYPSWMITLGNLLKDFYNVEFIRNYCYVYVWKDKKRICETWYYLELFGEPSNLDVAEYIAESLINNGLILYEDYKKRRSEEIKDKDLRWKHLWGRKCSKTAFMTGLLDAFADKLNDQKQDLEEEIAVSHGWDKALLLRDDPILRESYEKHYPRRHTTYGSHLKGDGHNAGRDAGRHLSLHRGVNAKSRERLLS